MAVLAARSARSRAARTLLALLTIAQFSAIGLAAFGDVRAPSRLAAHIEQPGNRGHYSHDEATCTACAIRHLVSPLPIPPRLALTASLQPVACARELETTITGKRRSPSSPRAPPARA